MCCCFFLLFKSETRLKLMALFHIMRWGGMAADYMDSRHTSRKIHCVGQALESLGCAKSTWMIEVRVPHLLLIAHNL